MQECLCFLLPSSGLLFLRLGGECSEFRSKLRGVSVGDCGVVIIVDKFRAINDVYESHAGSSVGAWWS